MVKKLKMLIPVKIAINGNIYEFFEDNHEGVHILGFKNKFRSIVLNSEGIFICKSKFRFWVYIKMFFMLRLALTGLKFYNFLLGYRLEKSRRHG